MTLFQPLILSILSVDCIPTAECAPTICATAVRSAVVFSSSQHFAQQLLTADCDDITVDIIIADPSTDSADVTAADPSCCLLILLTSSSP
ncbi:hypothetical protein F511_33820 [Dorcoceras hygrometricum]|uniref:Secreted protein n=1 Tax=Dorcoceras hygrometricum TaxID=472368 RepID=A0A2Z7B9M6_9LAMI|nr:hypothetical protein F511_33820 [Dorcoceras hygrometricum]